MSPAQTRLQRCRPGLWRAGLMRGYAAGWPRLCAGGCPAPPPQGAQRLECCLWSLLWVAKQMSPDSLPPNGTRPPYRRVANAADSTGAQSSALEELFLSSIQGLSGLTSHPPGGVRPQKWCFENEANTDPEQGTALRDSQSCVGGVRVRTRTGGMR